VHQSDLMSEEAFECQEGCEFRWRQYLAWLEQLKGKHAQVTQTRVANVKNHSKEALQHCAHPNTNAQ